MLTSTFMVVKYVLVFLTLSLVYTFGTAYLNYKKCSHIKGPFLATISGLWMFRRSYNGTMWTECAEVLEKYGSPARIAPGRIVTDDPALMRHMHAPRSNFTRGNWYDAMRLDPGFDHTFSQRDEKKHSLLRSKTSKGYSGKDIPNMESDLDDRLLDLVNLIRDESKTNRAFDFAHSAHYFSLDVLTQMAMGSPVGFVTRNEDIFSFLELSTQFLNILELAANFNWVQNILSSKWLAPMRPRPTDKTGMGAMIGVAQRAVRERYAEDAKLSSKQDMLNSFIKSGLTQREAENETMLQLLAGNDSTSTAIRMTLLHILTHPAVYSRLMAEIDAHADAGHISSPVITPAEAKDMPYLQAVIKEGLRIWPPLVGLAIKVAPPGGETVNGCYIPGGIEVALIPRAIQRRKDIYGPDADVFRPDRWLALPPPPSDLSNEDRERHDAHEAQLLRMHQTLDLTFGSGRFSCLGKPLVSLMLDKVFVTLLKDFEWSLDDPGSGRPPIETKTYGAHIQKNMWVRVKERVRT